MGGLRLVATIKYMGLGCIRMGVMVVVVVLMIRFVAADMSSSSSSGTVPSKGSTNDTVMCLSVGDGGPDKVVDGGVGIVVILSSFFS